MTYADAFKRPITEAYERLLLDCMRGDATLFNRRDSVDRAWELIQPVLQVWEATPGVHIYEPGTAGPRGRRRDDAPRRPQLARAQPATLMSLRPLPCGAPDKNQLGNQHAPSAYRARSFLMPERATSARAPTFGRSRRSAPSR